MQESQLFIRLFTVVSCATHTKSFKNLKLATVSSCMSLFNASMAQHVSAYLAIIRCINIIGEIAARLYTVVTCVDTFSWFPDLILNSEV
jgi:hypothetical protein